MKYLVSIFLVFILSKVIHGQNSLELNAILKDRGIVTEFNQVTGAVLAVDEVEFAKYLNSKQLQSQNLVRNGDGETAIALLNNLVSVLEYLLSFNVIDSQYVKGFVEQRVGFLRTLLTVHANRTLEYSKSDQTDKAVLTNQEYIKTVDIYKMPEIQSYSDALTRFAMAKAELGVFIVSNDKDSYNAARSLLDYSIQVDPKNSDFHFVYGVLHHYGKDPESRCTSWKASAELGNDQAFFLLNKYCSSSY